MIDAIVGDRQSGKTTELAHWFFESPSTRGIVVATHSTREYFIKHFGMNPDRIAVVGPLTFRGRSDIEEVGIDEVGLVLASVIGKYPAAITFTGSVRKPGGIPVENECVA